MLWISNKPQWLPGYSLDETTALRKYAHGIIIGFLIETTTDGPFHYCLHPYLYERTRNGTLAKILTIIDQWIMTVFAHFRLVSKVFLHPDYFSSSTVVLVTQEKCVRILAPLRCGLIVSLRHKPCLTMTGFNSNIHQLCRVRFFGWLLWFLLLQFWNYASIEHGYYIFFSVNLQLNSY